MAKGKFREQADDMNFSLSMLQNSAIKKAMAAGVRAAVITDTGGPSTVQDSSNAAVHWVVVPDKGTPRAPWKTMRDLRARLGRGKKRKGKRPPKVAVVGHRGSNHGNGRGTDARALAAVAKYLAARERREVLDRVVVGRLDPVRKFYFYNAIESGVFGKKGEDGAYDDYAENANLEAAGNAAVAAALKAAEEAFVAGFARSKFKK